MNNIVFWSGGMDSTLVAVDLLRERKGVVLLTVENVMIGGQEFHDKERLVRKKCLQKMKTEFGSKMIIHEEFLFDGKVEPSEHLGLASLLFNVMHIACEKDDEIYFGFVRYSDFWHYKNLFKRAHKHVARLDGKNMELHYPLEWIKKPEVAKRLKKLGYFNYTIHSDDFKITKVTIK